MLLKDDLMVHEVSPKTAEWMRKHGRSHVTLIRQWQEDTEMRDSIDFLTQQLAYAIQSHSKDTVAMRILGRISVLRRKQEKLSVKSNFVNSDMGVLM